MSLREYLEEQKVDEIEDDEEFCEAEEDAAYDYCKEKGFILSKEDLDCLESRGLDDSFEYWREDYEEEMCDGSIVATVDVDDYMLLGAMRFNNIPGTKENFAKCKEFLKGCIKDAMAMEIRDCLDTIMSNYEG